MIQDIAPHHYSNAWTPRQPQSDDLVFGFRERTVWVKEDGSFFQVRDLPEKAPLQYLFALDGLACFLTEPDAQGTFRELSTLRTSQPRWHAFAAITAWHLSTWYDHNRYCGRCGAPMILRQKERAMECPKCGNIVYPRINPAVIVGILNDRDQLLITRYSAGFRGPALVAGYAEIGETIESTVHREVGEETGLKVRDLTYFGSQPWAFSETLLMGFWCRVDGSDEVHLLDHELSQAVWTDPQDLPEITDTVSLTATMIAAYKKKKTGRS